MLVLSAIVSRWERIALLLLSVYGIMASALDLRGSSCGTSCLVAMLVARAVVAKSQIPRKSELPRSKQWSQLNNNTSRKHKSQQPKDNTGLHTPRPTSHHQSQHDRPTHRTHRSRSETPLPLIAPTQIPPPPPLLVLVLGIALVRRRCVAKLALLRPRLGRRQASASRRGLGRRGLGCDAAIAPRP